jgi:hypothetical protein
MYTLSGLRSIQGRKSRTLSKPTVSSRRALPVCGEFQFMQQWVSENDLCNEIATNNF